MCVRKKVEKENLCRAVAIWMSCFLMWLLSPHFSHAQDTLDVAVPVVPDSSAHTVFRLLEDAMERLPQLKERLADSLDLSLEEMNDLSRRKKKKLVSRFLGNQLKNLNQVDSLYITPQLYEYALMLQNTTTFESFTISSLGEDRQSLEFAPKPTFRLGGYFGWRWLFLGYTFDMGRLLGHKSASQQNTEIDLSIYTSKIGIDLYYRNTGNAFRCKNLNSLFSADSPRPDGLSDNFDGLNIQMRGFNIYYIFNHHHFSYPAAFSQSTVQRRSCGSFQLGFSFTHHRVSLDDSQFDERLTPYLDESMFFETVKYNDYELNFGYAYNWVFAKNCLLGVSLSPGLAYNATYYYAQSEDGTLSEKQRFPDFRLNKLHLDFISRFGLVYNNTRYFAGASVIFRSFDYKNSTVKLNNSFGSLNLYVGFNFMRKKNR